MYRRWLFFGGIEPEACARHRADVRDRNQVHAAGLTAEDGEVIGFAAVVAHSCRRIPVVSVSTARVEADGAGAESAGFALHAAQRDSIVYYEVVTRVLAKRDENRVPSVLKREHDRQCRPITDCFWVIHVDKIENGSDEAIAVDALTSEPAPE